MILILIVVVFAAAGQVLGQSYYDVNITYTGILKDDEMYINPVSRLPGQGDPIFYLTHKDSWPKGFKLESSRVVYGIPGGMGRNDRLLVDFMDVKTKDNRYLASMLWHEPVQKILISQDVVGPSLDKQGNRLCKGISYRPTDCSSGIYGFAYLENIDTIKHIVYCRNTTNIGYQAITQDFQDAKELTDSLLQYSSDIDQLLGDFILHRVVYREKAPGMAWIGYRGRNLEKIQDPSGEVKALENTKVLLITQADEKSVPKEELLDVNKELSRLGMPSLEYIDNIVFHSYKYGYNELLPVTIAGSVQIEGKSLYTVYVCLASIADSSLSFVSCKVFNQAGVDLKVRDAVVAVSSKKDGKYVRLSLSFFVGEHEKYSDLTGSIDISIEGKIGLQDASNVKLVPNYFAKRIGLKNYKVIHTRPGVRKYIWKVPVAESSETEEEVRFIEYFSTRREGGEWRYLQDPFLIDVEMSFTGYPYAFERFGNWIYLESLENRLLFQAKYINQSDVKDGTINITLPAYELNEKKDRSIFLSITFAPDKLELIDNSTSYTVPPGVSPIRFDLQRQVKGNLFRSFIDTHPNVKLFRSIANTLVYYREEENGSVVRLNTKGGIGTLDSLIDFESSEMYNCREVARSLREVEIMMKCRKIRNLDPPKALKFERIVQFEFKYGRLVATYTQNNSDIISFCVVHVRLIDGLWDERCIENIDPRFINNSKVIVGDNYTYVLVESKQSSGFFRYEDSKEWQILERITDYSYESVSYHLNQKSRYSSQDCTVTLSTYDRYLNIELEGGKKKREWVIKEMVDGGLNHQRPKYSCSSNNRLPVYSSDYKLSLINSYFEDVSQQMAKSTHVLKVNGLDCIDGLSEAVRVSDYTDYHGMFEISNGDEGIGYRGMRSEVVDIPSDLGENGFYTLSQAYFWNSTASEAANLDFNTESWYVNWTGKEEEVKLSVNLTAVYNRSNELQFNITFTNLSFKFDSVPALPRKIKLDRSIKKIGSEKFDIDFKLAESFSQVHFWNVKIVKSAASSDKMKTVQRFTKVDPQHSDLNKAKSYARFASVEAYYHDKNIIVMDSGKVLGRLPYTRSEVVEFISLHRTQDDSNKYRLSIRCDEIGYQKIDQFTFRMKGGSVERVNEATGSDFTYLSYDSLEYEIVHLGYDSMVGYIEKRNNRALTINSTSCPTTNLLVVPNVQSFALIQSPDFDHLGKRALLIYSVIGEKEMTVKSIDIKHCKYESVTGFSPHATPLLSLSKLECKFGHRIEASNEFRCVIASANEIRVQDYKMTTNTTINKISDDDYAPYSNMEVDQIQLSRPGTPDPDFFIIRGHRYVDFDENKEAALRAHDASGILYYRLKQNGGSGFASGGVDLDDLISYGVSSDYRLYLTTDNLLMIAGARDTVFLDVTEPSLSAGGLTRSELSSDLLLIVNTEVRNEVILTSEGFEKKSDDKIIGNRASSIFGFILLSAFLLLIVIPVLIYFKMNRSTVYDSGSDITRSMIDRQIEPLGISSSRIEKSLPEDNDL